MEQASEVIDTGSAVDAATIEALGEVPKTKKIFEDIEFTVTKSDPEGNPLEVKTDGGNTYTPESEGWDVLVQQNLQKKRHL